MASVGSIPGGFQGVGLLVRLFADRAFALGAVALCLGAATFLMRFLVAPL